MMEVMRIDDHAYEDKFGKIINPTLKKEGEIINRFKKLNNIPDNVNLIVNSVTDLPTSKDHNYDFYVKNFKRVVQKHSDKIDVYRNNHPGHDVIFFIYDESSAYFQCGKHLKINNTERQTMTSGFPHMFFNDKNFINIIKNCLADYFILYAPNKHIITEKGFLDFPKAIVYNVKKMRKNGITYNPNLMVSAEV